MVQGAAPSLRAAIAPFECRPRLLRGGQNPHAALMKADLEDRHRAFRCAKEDVVPVHDEPPHSRERRLRATCCKSKGLGPCHRELIRLTIEWAGQPISLLKPPAVAAILQPFQGLVNVFHCHPWATNSAAPVSLMLLGVEDMGIHHRGAL